MRIALTGIVLAAALSFSTEALTQHALAAAAEGGQIGIGLNKIKNNVDVPTSNKNIREAIVDAIVYVLSFLALIAVAMIIIAGFFMILGAGSESSVTRARKIILYTIIGLMVIFFARVIVGFFVSELPSVF